MTDVPPKLERLSATIQRLPGAAWNRARELVRDPARLLFGSLAVLLVILAVPLLIGGATRLERVWREGQHETTVDHRWVPTNGAVRAVRENDGLSLRLQYYDRHGKRHSAVAHVDAPGSNWLQSPLPIRYDPRDLSRVDVIGIADQHLVGRALVSGAAIGAGAAALVLGFALWRRRRELTLSTRSFTMLRAPLAISGFLLASGLTAWAVGTVNLQGWTSIANRIGLRVSDLFGNVANLGVPLVAFAGGCVITAWLARHRHHERHDGMLSSAHRIIDRASEYMPSPEQLRPHGEESTPGAAAPTESSAGEPRSGKPPHAA